MPCLGCGKRVKPRPCQDCLKKPYGVHVKAKDNMSWVRWFPTKQEREEWARSYEKRKVEWVISRVEKDENGSWSVP